MRLDLLQLIRKLLGILSTAAAIAETVQGVIGQPAKGQRAGDAQLQELAVKLPELGSSSPAPSSEPPGRPAGAPPAPIGTGVEVPRAPPAVPPGATITT